MRHVNRILKVLMLMTVSRLIYWANRGPLVNLENWDLLVKADLNVLQVVINMTAEGLAEVE